MIYLVSCQLSPNREFNSETDISNRYILKDILKALLKGVDILKDVFKKYIGKKRNGIFRRETMLFKLNLN